MTGDPEGPPAEILIGARGWEHEAWTGTFYPDGMPPEWRLTFYANAFRAVLIPAERLAATPVQQVARWPRDVPPGFVFYAELALTGGASGRVDPAALVERLAPLEGQLAGLVLGPGAEGLAPGRREELSTRLAVSWLDPPGDGPAASCAGTSAEGLVWRPGRDPWPTGGRGCVGLLDDRPRGPRALREVVEEFQRWSCGCGRAMLCFPGTPGAWGEMERARLIAELLAR